MKNLMLCSLLFFLTIDCFGQSIPIPTSWKIKKWSVSFGKDQDMLGKIEHNYLLSTARRNSTIDFSNLEFQEEELNTMICENPHLRFTLSLPVPGKKNWDLNLSALIAANKVDAVEYRSAGGPYEHSQQSLSFEAFTDELSLEATIIKRKNLANFINLYGGIGSNVGASLGGYLSVKGENIRVTNNEVNNFARTREEYQQNEEEEYIRMSKTYRIRKGWHQRGFAQAGVGFVLFKRVELGMEYRYGIGYRAVAGAEIKGTRYRSGALTFRWLLN